MLRPTHSCHIAHTRARVSHACSCTFTHSQNCVKVCFLNDEPWGGWRFHLEWQCVILTHDALLTHQCPRPLTPRTPTPAMESPGTIPGLLSTTHVPSLLFLLGSWFILVGKVLKSYNVDSFGSPVCNRPAWGKGDGLV